MDLTKSVTDCPPLLPSAGLRPQSGPRCWNWYIPTRGSFSPAFLRVFPSLPFRSILNYRLTNASQTLISSPFARHFSLHITYIALDRDILVPDSFPNFFFFPFRVRAFIAYPDNFLEFSRCERKDRKRKKKSILVSPSRGFNWNKVDSVRDPWWFTF